MNNLGKTFTIFLAVISILLFSLTVITLFFFQKENTQRILAENNLEMMKDKRVEIAAELKEANKQKFLVEEKFKEADEKINSLLDDLELEQGLREEFKTENQKLKELLASGNQTREQLREQFEGDLEEANRQVAVLKKQLSAEQARNAELQDKVEQLQKYLEQAFLPAQSDTAPKEKIQLEKGPQVAKVIPQGEVLSVDQNNGFVIVNVGQNHGVIEGLVMSIYRENKYLGDIRISRVQEDMSAADTIPPLSLRKIHKNDRVVIKQ